MTLPPLNTPIQHTGGATCPVHDDTVVTINGGWTRCYARELHWKGIKTYTIIARAPADRIKELEAALDGATMARKRLETMADDMIANRCDGGILAGRHLKRGLVGAFAEMDAALKGASKPLTDYEIKVAQKEKDFPHGF